MHSGELARLAGVTVRALRHYHQIGILAEPERRSNGYRSYDVHDLIRVLRIKRMASLGIPLERMPALLEDTANDNSDDAGALLDDLDAELAQQIERLTSQRSLIARLRDHHAAPDLPPELAPFLAVFAATGISPELVRMDRDQSVLLAHLAGEEGMPQLADFYGRISDPGLAPAVAAVSERFSRLGPDNTEQELAELVERFVEVFAPVLEDLADLTDFTAAPSLDLSGAAGLLSEFTSDLLNDQQRRIIQDLEDRLGGP